MTIEEQFKNLEAHMNARFDALNQRFDEIHRILLQIQTDVRVFYRELGRHDARLNNLEGK